MISSRTRTEDEAMKKKENKTPKEPFEALFTAVIRYFRWIVLAAVAIILLTGVYKVDSNEVAVVLRFGALTGSSEDTMIKRPGLHFALPNFIDEVVKIPVETVQELSISTLYTGSKSVRGEVQKTGYVLTGDSNVVLLRAVVKYKISDPITYALYVNNVKDELNGIVSGTLTGVLADMSVDDVLTTEKNSITSRTMNDAQRLIDGVRLGIQLTNVELTELTPPNEAIEAFNNATTASVKKQTLIQQANDYLAKVIPDAESESKTLVDNATALQAQKTAEATAMAEEFRGLLEQFSANPEVVKNGVFRMRLGKVLQQSGQSIVLPDEEGQRVILP